jgi:pimeloyl-ACP methyl ester carboxylesterase
MMAQAKGGNHVRRDRWGWRCILAVLVCLLAVGAASPASAGTAEVCFDVDLRGGTTKICADVHVNPRAPRSGTTILTVHGLTETAAAWGPLTRAIFADRQLRNRVRRVIAIDLPGHGDSPMPVGLPGGVRFGDLSIDDNVSVLIQSIRTLSELGLESRVIIGHSMGGLEIQGAQGVLLGQRSSLARLGIRRALLLAPVPAGGQRFTQPPPADLTAFLVTDPALGTFLRLSPDAARFAGGFTRPDGTLAAGTPDAATIAAFNGPEPLTTLLQLTDQIPTLPRPSVPMGGFSVRENGTLLSVVAFSQDVLVQPDDLDDLYNFLIGGRGLLFRMVDTPTAVHSMFIVDPVGLLNELKRLPLMLE